MASNKTVIGIVDTETQADRIVASLQGSGFSTNDISVLLPDRRGTRDFAHEHNTKAPEGAVAGVAGGSVVGGTLGLLAGIGALAIPGLGPFIAAGPLMAALSGAAVGGAVGGVAGALIGIVPLSTGLTRNLSTLGEGVRRIARGDYRARVKVKGRDEVAELAAAFNQMAEDVEKHQRAAIGQERIRRELELGRQIQHEMLPHEPLRLGLTEIKGVSVPAREVGGDFFNYFQTPSGEIANRRLRLRRRRGAISGLPVRVRATGSSAAA